jgi:NagD protein
MAEDHGADEVREHGIAEAGDGDEAVEEVVRAHAWLSDMDGVLVREGEPIPGAAEFIAALRQGEHPFLVLTNNSIWTARDLSARLRSSGLDIAEDEIWTSALATATFLSDQRPGGSVYVVGEAGLTSALHDAGFVMTDTDPDFVVLGETRTYSFEAITTAIRHIGRGARFIATNPDPTGPSPEGPLPACGAVAELISTATNRRPYVVGKPNPVMFRYAMNMIGAHSESTTMVGDRMDTDVVAGMEAGLRTVLVLSGSTSADEVERYPYRPSLVRDSVADLVEIVKERSHL